METIIIFIIIIILIIVLASRWEYFTQRYVIKKRGGSLIVIDGDTFWSRRHKNKIRIIGIDCPEKGEPGFSEARNYLYKLLSSGSLRVVKKGIDKYGRILAHVYINGENVAAKIKEMGFDKLDSRYK